VTLIGYMSELERSHVLEVTMSEGTCRSWSWKLMGLGRNRGLQMTIMEGSCKKQNWKFTGVCIGVEQRIIFCWTSEANCPELEPSGNGPTQKVR
jgi:hypothetical protein